MMTPLPPSACVSVSLLLSWSKHILCVRCCESTCLESKTPPKKHSSAISKTPKLLPFVTLLSETKECQHRCHKTSATSQPLLGRPQAFHGVTAATQIPRRAESVQRRQRLWGSLGCSNCWSSRANLEFRWDWKALQVSIQDWHCGELHPWPCSTFNPL